MSTSPTEKQIREWLAYADEAETSADRMAYSALAEDLYRAADVIRQAVAAIRWMKEGE